MSGSRPRLSPSYDTLDEWIARDAIPFALDDPSSLNAAIDRIAASFGDAVELLGLGEGLHGGSDILTLRNRLFERLVDAHGFGAIAVESSFPRGYLVNEYIAGRGPASFEDVQNAGFSHGFGRLEANRALVAWMRDYNADPSHPLKLRFYGFDSPTEMVATDSPRRVLAFVLGYLAGLDGERGQDFRDRIEPLIGPDADWENPAAMMDPAQAVGGSEAARALRIETEELIAALRERRPEWIARSDRRRYLEAVHHAEVARQLLTYHAGLARPSQDRTARLLGLRDAMMADNLAYIASQERERGKVLVFAHNSHLQYGQARWQLGPDLLTWWPAGAHVGALMGERYAVIGTGVGVSEANGIGQPEAGTLEARLVAAPGPVRFIPTYRGQGLPADAIAALPTRSGSTRNTTYFPMTPHFVHDFDAWVVLDSTGYARGAPPLQG